MFKQEEFDFPIRRKEKELCKPVLYKIRHAKIIIHD